MRAPGRRRNRDSAEGRWMAAGLPAWIQFDAGCWGIAVGWRVWGRTSATSSSGFIRHYFPEYIPKTIPVKNEPAASSPGRSLARRRTLAPASPTPSDPDPPLSREPALDPDWADTKSSSPAGPPALSQHTRRPEPAPEPDGPASTDDRPPLAAAQTEECQAANDHRCPE